MSVKGGICAHEAYEAKKIQYFFCYVNTSHRHRFYTDIYYLFLSTAFPQLSFKSFQSLKDFFPLALLTTTIVFRTHSLREI